MYQLIQYIKYKLTAKNQHSVHSPFVYDLVTKCFYDKTDYQEYKLLKEYRTALLNSKTVIDFTDFGEGSKTSQSNKRPVSEMAKKSASLEKSARLLYRFTKYFKQNTYLELGTSLGMATYAMALGNPNSKITTIEGCPNTSNFSKSQFKTFSIQNTTFKSGNFKDVLPTLEQSNFDLIFFDGNHNKDATIAYFETLLPKAHNNTVFIFDDIYWSKGMTEAWEYIKQHPKPTITIDTFLWGFVFFRNEQPKQHFKIRV
jgi:predicted O-methyltransferase YrrM